MLDAGPVEFPEGNPIQQGWSLDAGFYKDLFFLYQVSSN